MEHEVRQIEHVAELLRGMRIVGSAEITKGGEIKGAVAFSHDPAALADTLEQAVRELEGTLRRKIEGIEELPSVVPVKRAADVLGVTPRTVRRWVDMGRIPAIKTSPGRPGRVLVRRAEINRFLEKNESRSRGW